MNRLLYFILLCSVLFVQKSYGQYEPKVKTGLEVLKESGFSILKGKNIGLITNPTGVDNNLNSTIDILNNDKSINLIAIFSPEHGVRGNVNAGDKISLRCRSCHRITGIFSI